MNKCVEVYAVNGGPELATRMVLVNPAHVMTIRRSCAFLAWPDPLYRVMLTNGSVLHITAEKMLPHVLEALA